LVLTVGLVLFQAAAALGGWLWLRFDILTWGELWPLMFVVTPIGLVISGVIAVRSLREDVRPILQWIRGAHDREAHAAWLAAFRLPTANARRVVVLGQSGAVVALLYVAAVTDLPAWGYLVALAGLVEAVTAAAVVSVILAELAVRPIVLETTPLLPPMAEPPRGVPLRTRLVVGAPVIVVAFAVVTAGLTAHDPDLTDGAIINLVSLGLGAVLGLPLALVAAQAFLSPISELTAATERMRDGDFTVRAPVLSGDETGVLTASFNEMVDELVRSRSRIVAASDAERRRMERDLHDGAQQHLMLLRMKLTRLEKVATDEAAALAADAREDLATAIEQLRDLAHGIYPAVLENDGLAEALREAARRSAIAVTVSSNGLPRYPPDVESAVYFCCLEAVQNATKHAGDGANVTVDLNETDGVLQVEIADDGVGFNPVAARDSAGMRNMSDRIGALGGRLDVASTPGEGARITARVPVSRDVDVRDRLHHAL
jgi:signal transduction histidine kinase